MHHRGRPVVQMEVSHELTTCNTKHIREQKHDEVCIVLTMKEAVEAFRPLEHRNN